MTRREYGHARTSCGCDACVMNCRYMPGMLAPSDLGRMAPDGDEEAVMAWAERDLRASRGALAAQGENLFRIPTLVPAARPDGSCIHLEAGRCAIHADAPFGCAFFDCGPDPGISGLALADIARAHIEGALYGRIWARLWERGLRSAGPMEARARMAKALSEEGA
jgi:hypothetical protein